MPTYLYAIGSYVGPVKIGISDNPRGRLAQFQTSCPFPIRLIHAQACESRGDALADERFAHKMLKDKHLHGEWFDISGRDAHDFVVGTVISGASFRERAEHENIVDGYVKALGV